MLISHPPPHLACQVRHRFCLTLLGCCPQNSRASYRMCGVAVQVGNVGKKTVLSFSFQLQLLGRQQTLTSRSSGNTSHGIRIPREVHVVCQRTTVARVSPEGTSRSDFVPLCHGDGARCCVTLRIFLARAQLSMCRGDDSLVVALTAALCSERVLSVRVTFLLQVRGDGDVDF